MEWILLIFMGIGIGGACGYRIFIPFLITSIASKAGYLELSDGFSWIGTTEALAVFSVASLVEIVAYYFPVIDNFLDTLVVPLSVVAGSILGASYLTELDPLLQWTLAIIAGGGIAGLTKAVTSSLRLGSTASTGGLFNGFIATFETVSAFVWVAVASISPLVICLFLLLSLLFVFYIYQKRRKKLIKRKK